MLMFPFRRALYTAWQMPGLSGYSIKGAGVRRRRSDVGNYRPLNIRGVVYEHYSECNNESKAATDKEELQKKGFRVLVRKYGPRKYHVYKGPKRKTGIYLTPTAVGLMVAAHKDRRRKK